MFEQFSDEYLYIIFFLHILLPENKVHLFSPSAVPTVSCLPVDRQTTKIWVHPAPGKLIVETKEKQEKHNNQPLN